MKINRLYIVQSHLSQRFFNGKTLSRRYINGETLSRHYTFPAGLASIVPIVVELSTHFDG